MAVLAIETTIEEEGSGPELRAELRLVGADDPGPDLRPERPEGWSSWRAYLRSDHWCNFRVEVRMQTRYVCAVCNRVGGLLGGRYRGRDLTLDLHHRHYRTVGRETLDDVEWRCGHCHRQLRTKEKGRR